ncbi:MAG: 3-phosphoshikimate 1-carboxyvinyltransferase, partial [Spirochaetales bacterium]|nr:3-phosphoshikimate 1-carboxyvinyltransferase [Spirochaetales bacterium]
MNKTLYPGSVWGQVDIPASKSQTIHALLLALFSKGVSTITNPLLCSDTQACL